MESICSVLTWTRLFLTFTLMMMCIAGDFLLKQSIIQSSNTLRGIVDNGTHGIVGLLSWAVVVKPSLLSLGTLLKESILWEIILCGILSSLLDVDHFAAAGTIKLQSALSLKYRPPFHATTLIPVVCLFLYLVIRLLKLQKLRRLPLIILVAWLSHQIRDATRRGLWFWPWGSTLPLPYWFYISLIAVLPYMVIALMDTAVYGNGSSSIDSRQLPVTGGMQHV